MIYVAVPLVTLKDIKNFSGWISLLDTNELNVASLTLGPSEFSKKTIIVY